MRIHMRTHMTIHMRTHMRAHMSTDDGDKQCIRINALFSKELMLFQQFCCSVVGRYQPVQAHLCIRATTFYALPVPLPRQVFMLVQMGV